MLLKNAEFTVFDFETTGLYPYSGDKICEIGAIRTSLGKSEKIFHSMVDPQCPISPGAFSVNKITEEMIKDAPKVSEILASFMKFIEGSVLVAYNAGFDVGFLENALGEKSDVLTNYCVVDALKLARKLFPGMPRYSLANLSRSLGIYSGGEHRAISDARMTLNIFLKELDILIAEGITTVDGLASVHVKKAAAISKVTDYKIDLIKKAIREQKKLNIAYLSGWENTLTRRAITPKEIKQGYDKSYVVAYCHLKKARRNFRLDSIIEASPANK